MKKLTIFLALLLSVGFTKMSAQSNTQGAISWAIYGETNLKIFVNDVLIINQTSTGENLAGVFFYNSYDEIKIETPSTLVVCEDNYIGSGRDGFFYEPALYDAYNDPVISASNYQFKANGNDLYIEAIQ